MISPNSKGILSREITLVLLNGEESKFFMHVLIPKGFEKTERITDSQQKVLGTMSDFKLIPFKQESPFVTYIDRPIQILQVSHRRFLIL